MDIQKQAVEYLKSFGLNPEIRGRDHHIHLVRTEEKIIKLWVGSDSKNKQKEEEAKSYCRAHQEDCAWEQWHFLPHDPNGIVLQKFPDVYFGSARWRPDLPHTKDLEDKTYVMRNQSFLVSLPPPFDYPPRNAVPI